MNLPTPTPDEVKEFTALYERKFGVALDPDEAWDAAMRTLRLFYLCTYDLNDRENEGFCPQRVIRSKTRKKK